jgi:uncharacterized protein YndB with AHSA1/START domain
VIETSTPDVVVERTINATPDRIYAAFTDPKELERWFFTDCTVSPSPAVVGGTYRHTWRGQNPGTHHRFGKFLELVPGRKIAFQWRGEQGDSVSIDGLGDTVVTITLTPEGRGTRVKLVHSGWAATTAASEMRDKHNGGWNFYVDNLSRYLTGSGHDERTANHTQHVNATF